MKKHILSIMGIFLISLLFIMPLFIEPYHAGHDTKYHIANAEAIKEQVLDGNIPTSPILDKIGYGLGYGTRLFYPPLAHTVTGYLAAGLSEFDIGILGSFRVAHFLTLFLSGVTMYFLVYKLTDRKLMAFFSAIIYMSFPYHLSDIYVRDSLAECFLFVFLPMILSGVYSLLKEDVHKFYPLFVVGYVGGILSHFTMMIYFTMILGISLMLSRKQVFTKKFLIPFLIATISVIGITSFFTCNMIVHRLFGDYVVFEPGEMTKRIATSALSPFEYFNVIPILQGDIKYYFPIIVLILLGITIIYRKKLRFPKYTENLVLFGLIAFVLSTNVFPWGFAPSFLKMIQFPWRLQVFIGLIVSIFAPFCLQKIDNKKIVGLILIVLFVSAYQAISFPNQEIVNSHDTWWNGGMGWQKEYLPLKAKINKQYITKKKQKIDFVSGTGKYKIISNKVPELSFSIEIDNPVIIELPRLYYFGYYLEDSNKNEVKLSESKYGLLSAEIKSSGNYYLQYNGNGISKICYNVSIILLVVNIVGYSGYLIIRKKHSN